MATYSEEDEDVDFPEIELFDLIEYEDNGQEHLAYYIGEGRFVLLEKTDCDKPNEATLPPTAVYEEVESDLFAGIAAHWNVFTTGGFEGLAYNRIPESIVIPEAEDTIDAPTIIEWKKIVTCKYKIKRDEAEWRKVDNGIDDIKEHDVIEIAHSAGIRHFAICSGNGKAVDLNPEHSAYVIGKPPFSSFSRSSRLADTFGVERGYPPKNSNGIIQERSIHEVIQNRKFRIRSPKIMVDIKRSNIKKVYYVEPLPTEQISERIKKAVELGKTQYNIFRKNCEHFIMWLKYGVIISYQTERLKLITPLIDRLKS